MKNFKIVLATLCIAVLGIAVSSFTVKSYNKRAFSTVCYKFTVSGVTAASLQSLNSTTVNYWHDGDNDGNFDTINWTVTTTEVPQNCDNIPYICGICFDNANGFTIQKAVDGLITALQGSTPPSLSPGSTYTVPNPGFPDVTVTFYERSTTF